MQSYKERMLLSASVWALVNKPKFLHEHDLDLQVQTDRLSFCVPTKSSSLGSISSVMQYIPVQEKANGLFSFSY